MEKRVLIVDFNHLVHTYMNSSYRLSVSLNSMMGKVPDYVLKYGVDGGEIDTTVQNSVVKNICKWSKNGFYPTVVCFDSPVPARKAYFAGALNMPLDTSAEYKGGRSRMSDLMYKALGMTFDILSEAGIATVKADNYEADDLVFAAIQKAKELYPGVPIDVITNDVDLVPLVDNVVSVFLRSKKGTYSKSKEYERLHYIQITPENYQEVVENLSRYKNFFVPYNTVLLHKLLRGDPADNLPGISKLFPPRKYNKILDDMIEHHYDISEIFRYGECPVYYEDINTGIEERNQTKVDDNPSGYKKKYKNPRELVDILDIMSKYTDDEGVLDHISKMYIGMNLNQVYYYGDGTKVRRPARLKPFSGFSDIDLQQVVLPLKINLNLK